MLLSKITYGEVVRGLKKFKEQDDVDYAENPSRIPIDWRSSIYSLIERSVRKRRERFWKGLPDAVMEYLVEKGVLVPYLGDILFQGGNYRHKKKCVNVP